MFELFSSKYEIDKFSKAKHQSIRDNIPAKGFKEFFETFSGASFNKGLYRVHSIEQLEQWNNLVEKAFPEFVNRIHCFGYDWLGRQFALDYARMERNEPLVLMFEPGTGEVLEIPTNFLEFHENEIINYCDEALAVNFYKQWLSSTSKVPQHNQCIGYSKPLYLGGTDTLSNLEILDIEVYWELTKQLLDKVKGLSLGTKIDKVSIE